MSPEYLFKNVGAFSPTQLDRLARGRVSVAGLGAFAGGAVALAQLGVGTQGFLRIADPDTFERHNANRQPLATVSNTGKNKTDEVAAWIRDLVPEVRLEAYRDGVTLENLDQFIAEAEVVVDAVDFLRPDVKLALHSRCREKNIPVVTGLLVGKGAINYNFLHDGPDFEEFFACPQNPQLRKTWTMPASRIMPPQIHTKAALMHTYEVLNGLLPITSNPLSAGTSHLLLGTMVVNLLLGLPVPRVSFCDFGSLKMGELDFTDLIEEHRTSVWTRMAELYDLILARAPIFAELVGKYRTDLQGCARILEAGAGTGIIAEALAEGGSEVHAIDRNLEMLAYARQRKSLLVGEGDVEELFFPDEYFDGYLSNNVVLFSNLEKTLQEAFRVLKPGGKLAISSAQVLPDLQTIGASHERLVASGIPSDKARAFLDLQAEMIPTSQPHSAESTKALLAKLGFRLLKEEQAYAGVNFYLVAQK